MHDDEHGRDDRELTRDSIASGDGAPVIRTAEALLELLLVNPKRRAVAYPMHDCGSDPSDLGRLAVCEFVDNDFEAAWRSTILAWIADDGTARALVDIASNNYKDVAIFPNGQRLLFRWLLNVWRLDEQPPPRCPRPRGTAWAYIYPPRLH